MHFWYGQGEGPRLESTLYWPDYILALDHVHRWILINGCQLYQSMQHQVRQRVAARRALSSLALLRRSREHGHRQFYNRLFSRFDSTRDDQGIVSVGRDIECDISAFRYARIQFLKHREKPLTHHARRTRLISSTLLIHKLNHRQRAGTGVVVSYLDVDNQKRRVSTFRGLRTETTEYRCPVQAVA